MIEDASQHALRLFSKDYNCAQSVMKAILVAVDMDFNEIVFLAAGLGGGVSHEGNVCGAVSGAVAALGVINSRISNDVQQHKQNTYIDGEKFIQRFKKEHSTIICRDLTGINISNKASLDKAIRDGTFERTCPAFVENAVRYALELVENKL
ncbi:MAG: C_GCAxxG_C_C family protein [Candidatus Thorarchaeota archaeon]|nr:C_GCAxxG_C_C family protein [Candidatus Thorarchaeota archaeon]